MSARMTSLVLSAIDLGGTSYLDNVTNFELGHEFTVPDGESITMRYEHKVVTKRRNTFRLSMLRLSTGRRVSMLDLSVMSIGGVAFVSETKEVTCNVSTKTVEASAGNSAFTYPNAVGTTVSFQVDLMVTGSNSNTLLDSIADGAISGLSVATVMTIDSNTFNAPMVITGARRTAGAGDVQRWTVNLALQATVASDGGITTAFSGNTLLNLILAGAATATFTLTSKSSGGNTYSGTAMMINSTITARDSEVIKDDHEFEVMGTLTASTN